MAIVHSYSAGSVYHCIQGHDQLGPINIHSLQKDCKICLSLSSCIMTLVYSVDQLLKFVYDLDSFEGQGSKSGLQ